MGTWVKVKVPIFMGSWTSQVQPDLKGTTVGFYVSGHGRYFVFISLHVFTILSSRTLGGPLFHNLWNTGCPSFIINISSQVLGR